MNIILNAFSYEKDTWRLKTATKKQASWMFSLFFCYTNRMLATMNSYFHDKKKQKWHPIREKKKNVHQNTYKAIILCKPTNFCFYFSNHISFDKNFCLQSMMVVAVNIWSESNCQRILEIIYSRLIDCFDCRKYHIISADALGNAAYILNLYHILTHVLMESDRFNRTLTYLFIKPILKLTWKETKRYILN